MKKKGRKPSKQMHKTAPHKMAMPARSMRTYAAKRMMRGY